MRRRLILANLTLVAVLLVVLEVPLALIYSRHEHDALNATLQSEAASLAAVSGEIIEHPGGPDVHGVAKRFSADSGGVAVVVDRSGALLTLPDGLSSKAKVQAELAAARTGASRRGEVDDLVYVAVPLGPADTSRGAVLIARSDDSIDQRVRRSWLLLCLVGAAVLAFSLLVSTRLSRWVIDPLRRLDSHATKLGRGDLKARADTRTGPPEVVTLAATFNEMADRLDALVTSQRRFVADASHQLRTPLTALCLRLENLHSDDMQAIAITRDAALEETARLTRLVDGLLSLARAESHRADREQVDVAAAITERQEAWAPLAAEQGIDLTARSGSAPPLWANLVPGHLEQILDNLIDNALEASQPGGTVDLHAAQISQTIEIHVTDVGRGMTNSERAHAFDPFWQSPHGHASGSTGLGLAIAQQLARACSATITLDPSPAGGIDAIVRLPQEPAHLHR
ncbi:MAG: HAMP domain-containing sensor histidine kinase [Acidimicrobiales bacterium]